MSETERTLADVVCRDVLFAHWPIDAARLRPAVPDALSIDTYDGSAWLGILVVNIAEARIRGVPYRPSLPSINLRTYVSLDGEPGVYFISLEMDGKLSSWVARNGFGLPYHDATIDSEYRDGALAVESHRTTRSGPPARFVATYRPATDEAPTEAAPDTLDEFLIERTNYFFEATEELRQTGRLLGTTDGASRSPTPSRSASPPPTSASMMAGAATHDPWPLLPVEATITDNTLFAAAGVPEPDATPTYHYSRQQHMAAERLQERS